MGFWWSMMTFSVLPSLSLPRLIQKLLRNGRLLRCLGVLTVAMVSAYQCYPILRIGLKRVIITAGQDLDDLVATCQSILKSFIGCRH